MKKMIIDAQTVFGFWHIKNINISIEQLLKVAKAHGVDKMLSLSTKGFLYDYEQGNDETLEMSRRYDEIIPVATVDLRRYFGCLEEIEKRYKQGFKIFRFFREHCEWPIHYAPFLKILKELNRFRIPMMIDVGVCKGIVTQLAEVSKGLDVPILLTEVCYDNLSEIFFAAQDNPNLYIATRTLCTPDVVEVIKEQMGINRLIFASGAPLFYMGPSLTVIKKAKITEEERDLILGGNIARLLGGL